MEWMRRFDREVVAGPPSWGYCWGEVLELWEEVPGALPIERDINKRWEAGTPHHPRSQALYRRLAELDRNHNHFGWRSGGDGDNGEILMYGLDVLFEEDDAAGQSA